MNNKDVKVMASNGKSEKKSENKFLKFFKDLKSEFKRITWASKEEVKKAFWASISFCLIYILFVYILDLGFQKLFNAFIYKIG